MAQREPSGWGGVSTCWWANNFPLHARALSDPKEKFQAAPCARRTGRRSPPLRSLSLECLQCHHLYAMVAAIRTVVPVREQYHTAAPPPITPGQSKLAELMAIWRASECHYDGCW